MTSRLVEDAKEIWQAGVAAVQPQRLMQHAFEATGGRLTICGTPYDLAPGTKVKVVAAGKASRHMAEGFLQSTASILPQIEGWVLEPGDGEGQLGPLLTFGVRPLASNLPTRRAIELTTQILHQLRQSNAADLLVVLLSGGASAILCAPTPPLTLNDKLAVINALAGAGADITELNEVRRCLSQVKGGGLLQAFHGSHAHTLAISDVCNDPPSMIGSGPTIVGVAPGRAKAIMERYGLDDAPAFESARNVVAASPVVVATPAKHHFDIVGNNSIAKKFAALKAEEMGYQTFVEDELITGPAGAAGKALAEQLNAQAFATGAKRCYLSGGETTVVLGPKPGKGGRNLHLAAAALRALPDWPKNTCLLSAGSDGEDGPTDAAGAFVDAAVAARSRGAEVQEALDSQNTYGLFEQNAGLFRPGLTGTNVMDLQVMLIDNVNNEA